MLALPPFATRSLPLAVSPGAFFLGQKPVKFSAARLSEDASCKPRTRDRSHTACANSPPEKNIGQIFWGIHSLFEFIRPSLIPYKSPELLMLIVTSRRRYRRNARPNVE
jgi:hypothetical protein